MTTSHRHRCAPWPKYPPGSWSYSTSPGPVRSAPGRCYAERAASPQAAEPSWHRGARGRARAKGRQRPVGSRGTKRQRTAQAELAELSAAVALVVGLAVVVDAGWCLLPSHGAREAHRQRCSMRAGKAPRDPCTTGTEVGHSAALWHARRAQVGRGHKKDAGFARFGAWRKTGKVFVTAAATSRYH